MQASMTIEEVSALILSGKRLFLAGNEALLASLPRGQWVGGTVPCFMSEEGCLCSHDRLLVSQLPDPVTAFSIRSYDVKDLQTLPEHYAANGFTRLLIPAFSPVHQRFALDSTSWDGTFDQPLVGWVAGVSLDDAGTGKPKVFHGESGEASSTHAIAVHVELPPNLVARAHILNLFHPGAGESITFPRAGFTVSEALLNGQRIRFADWLTAQHIDHRLPLVADYMGARVNVSIRSIDSGLGKVNLYAPVFPGVEYRFAEPITDYAATFQQELAARNTNPLFACNCVLSYFYANLAGQRTGSIIGPFAYGEIAWMLLNQTMVYLTLDTI